MTGLSKREAARQWGKARATIDRDVASGKLSLTGDKLIDPAEMLRVYGEPKGQQGRPKAEASEPEKATPEATEKTTEIMALQAKLQVAEAMLAAKDDLLAAKDELLASKEQTLSALEGQLRLLTHDRPAEPKRKRWWQRG